MFGAPGHGGEVGDESAQVLLLYSVVVAAGREGQDGASSLISASWKKGKRFSQELRRIPCVKPLSAPHVKKPITSQRTIPFSCLNSLINLLTRFMLHKMNKSALVLTWNKGDLFPQYRQNISSLYAVVPQRPGRERWNWDVRGRKTEKIRKPAKSYTRTVWFNTALIHTFLLIYT